MRSFRLLLFSLGIFTMALSWAQDESRWKTGVEIGSDFYNCNAPSKDFIRQDRVLYGAANSTSSLTSGFSSVRLAVKREKFLTGSNISLGYGLSFTDNVATLGKNLLESDHNDYFFLQFKQDGLNTEYLRLHSLEEHNLALGIPLEAMITVFKIDNLSFYIRGGTDFSVLVYRKVKANFYDSKMESYASEVEKIPGKAAVFQSRAYGAWGMSVEKPSGLVLDLELVLPSFFLTDKPSSLADPNFGTGILLRLMFPGK